MSHPSCLLLDTWEVSLSCGFWAGAADIVPIVARLIAAFPEGVSDVTRILEAAQQGDPTATAEAMRRILVERARSKSAAHHDGGQ